MKTHNTPAEIIRSQLAKATPVKLRSGEWGAKVQGQVREGDTVTITTRAGKSWEARVSRVVWHGGGVSICATGGRGGRGPGRRRGGCHTDGDCSSTCVGNHDCPCRDGGWFSCC